MEAIGFETRQFINNIGTFSFYIIAFSTLLTIWLIIFTVGLFRVKKAIDLRRRLGRKIFWNRLSQGIMESIMIVTFCSLIQFNHNFIFNSWGQKLQTWIAIIVFMVYVLVPIYTLTRIILNFDKVKDKDFIARFGELYGRLTIKNGRKVLLEPITFLIRRIFLVFLVIYGV